MGYSARALGEDFRLTEGSDRDVLAQLQLMPWKTALLTFWMASNPVSRIFLFSKSSRRSRAVVFWLQIFTTTSIQFFLSDSASLTVGEGDSVDMCFPFSGPVASIILYAITFVVDSICTNKVGILYKKCGDSPPMRSLFFVILCCQVLFLYAFLANTNSDIWYMSCFALALTFFQRTVFWVVFEGFWLMVILRRARRNLDSDSKEKSSMVKAVDCRLVESKNNFDERATMSAIHGEDGEWHQDECGMWYQYKNARGVQIWTALGIKRGTARIRLWRGSEKRGQARSCPGPTNLAHTAGTATGRTSCSAACVASSAGACKPTSNAHLSW